MIRAECSIQTQFIIKIVCCCVNDYIAAAGRKKINRNKTEWDTDGERVEKKVVRNVYVSCRHFGFELISLKIFWLSKQTACACLPSHPITSVNAADRTHTTTTTHLRTTTKFHFSFDRKTLWFLLFFLNSKRLYCNTQCLRYPHHSNDNNNHHHFH